MGYCQSINEKNEKLNSQLTAIKRAECGKN